MLRSIFRPKRYLAAVLVLVGLVLAPFSAASSGPTHAASAGGLAAVATVAASQQCGTIETLGPNPPRDLAAAQQVATCFRQAYAQCQDAMMSLRVGGVDTVRLHTFTLEQTVSRCVIHDAVQFTVVPRPPTSSAVTCTGLHVRDDGLLFTACGEQGDVFIAGVAPNGPDFADPVYERLWTRTDSLVAAHTVARSWLWGPHPLSEGLAEPYQGAPHNVRLVQYFDKSRMEINFPQGDPNDPFYITNGLLVLEMISGRMQVGDTAYETHDPAQINVAGDVTDPNAPTYASFQKVANTPLGDHKAADRTGQPATATLDRAGTVGDDPGKTKYTGITLAHYEASVGHNIPQVFWDFLNQRGPVVENGKTVTAPLSQPWFYASGLPISEPYWATVQVAGQPTAVLVQAFERRVLTYTPTNTLAFQVEMGNVGAHYYSWRYGSNGPPNP